MSEDKFEYEACFVGRPARFDDRFVKGIWVPVEEKEAKHLAKKTDFKVRDVKGNPIDEAFFQARNAKEQAAAMKAYAIREREQERQQAARTGLTAAGVRRQGEVPHDEGYVPREGALDASDGLPPAGFEIVDGAPKKAIKGPLPSQRFDPGQARELSTLRIGAKEDPSIALNVEAALAGTKADLAVQLKNTPIHQISRA